MPVARNVLRTVCWSWGSHMPGAGLSGGAGQPPGTLSHQLVQV